MTRPTLLVVICSTRPGRIGRAIGDWFLTQAEAHEGFKVAVADLAVVNLPLMDEPNHPSQHRYVHQHTRQWSATVAAVDAVVFVTPEYNYSMPATLKNAIDYLFVEWSRLATGWVSYGGMSGGLRSVQHAKQPATAVGMVSTRAAVSLPFAGPRVNEGVFGNSDDNDQAAHAMLDELLTLSRTLAPLRASALAALEE